MQYIKSAEVICKVCKENHTETMCFTTNISLVDAQDVYP